MARRCEDALFAEAGQLELVVTLALTICVPSPRYVSTAPNPSCFPKLLLPDYDCSYDNPDDCNAVHDCTWCVSITGPVGCHDVGTVGFPFQTCDKKP